MNIYLLLLRHIKLKKLKYLKAEGNNMYHLF